MHQSPLLTRFQPWANQPGSILLESNHRHEQDGRYSVMAVHPFLVITAQRDQISLLTRSGRTAFHGNPLQTLEDLLKKYAAPLSPYGPGAFGFFSYELGYPFQKLAGHPVDDLNLPDLWFAFYKETLVYDHVDSKISRYSIQGEKPMPVDRLIEKTGPPVPCRTKLPHWSQYRNAFKAAMDNIEAGNIYQVNLSQRFSGPCREEPWEVYLRLRKEHPTAYSAYLNTGHSFILSASPELYLKKEKNLVQTRPIKGTVRKSANMNQEKINIENLKNGPKEQAEHIMIVDLERNDLGKVCKPGSIKVNPLFQIEGCGQVNHMVSTVQGELEEGIGFSEIIQAAFPGGSVTGAPKRKAMEIIRNLESTSRGVYTGALGWIGFSGDFTLNLPIRTVLIRDQMAHIHVGSGIVADSSAEQEYQEILDKGAPFFELLGLSIDEAVLA